MFYNFDAQGRGSTPDEDVTMDDVEPMRRAMALAAAVRSTTAPNPWVGCVIVAAGPGGSAGAVVGVLSGAHDAAALEAASPIAVLTDVTGLVSFLGRA